MASANDLVVTARFRDLVTKQVSKLSSTFITFGASAVKAVKSVASGLAKMTVVLNQGLAIIGKVGAALKKLGGLISVPVNLAAEQERVEAKLNAVLRATGGAAGFAAEELFRMADSLQEVTGFGDEATINAQAILLTFKSIKKEGGFFDRALEVSLDLAELLDGDLQQSVIMIGKAMEEPAVGLSALRRVGVTFSTDQVKLIQKLVETNQVFKAQEQILQGLEAQVKGVAREMRGTFYGTLRALKSEWGDFLEVIGRQLTMNPKLIGAMEAIIVKLREWKESFFETGALGEKVQGFVEMLIALLPALIRGVGGAVAMFARFAVVLNNVLIFVGEIFGAIGDLIGSLADMDLGFGKIFSSEAQGFLAKLGETFRAIAGVGDKGLAIEVDDSAMLKLIKTLGTVAPEFADELAKAVEESFAVIRGKAPETVVSSIGAGAERELSLIERLQNAWKAFGEGWDAGMNQRLKELRNISSEVSKLSVEFLDGTQSALVDFFKAMRDGTASLSDGFGQLIDAVRLKLSDMFLEFAANRVMQGLLEGLTALSGFTFGGNEKDIVLASNTLAIKTLTLALDSSALLGGAGTIPTLSEDKVGELSTPIEDGQVESVSIWTSIGNGLGSLGGIFMEMGSFLYNGLMTIVSAIGSLIASGWSSLSSLFASTGGAVNYLAGGGPPLFHPKGTDTIPAMLSPGEFVLRRSAVQAIGLPALEQMNRAKGFADGGLVGGSSGGADGNGITVNLSINAIDARTGTEFLTSRAGREAITGVFRRAMSTQPNVQKQIKGLGR